MPYRNGVSMSVRGQEMNVSASINVVGYVRTVTFVHELHNASDTNQSTVQKFSRLYAIV